MDTRIENFTKNKAQIVVFKSCRIYLKSLAKTTNGDLENMGIRKYLKEQ